MNYIFHFAKGPSQNEFDFPPPPTPSQLINMNEHLEMLTMISASQLDTKTMIVNNSGETSTFYHSLADPEHYPDLLKGSQSRKGFSLNSKGNIQVLKISIKIELVNLMKEA